MNGCQMMAGKIWISFLAVFVKVIVFVAVVFEVVHQFCFLLLQVNWKFIVDVVKHRA